MYEFSRGPAVVAAKGADTAMKAQFKWIAMGLLVLLGSALWLQPARANGVVGSGTPASCTELQLDAALQFGGAVSFNCGPAPITITVQEKVITATTSIDGGGLVTLSGNHANDVFSVTLGVTLTLANLRVADGYANQLFTGGAIFNAGTLIVQNSQVVNSTCDVLCVASGIANLGTLQMYDSVVKGNSTQLGSGGISNFTTKSAQIIRSTIRDNRVLNTLAGGGGGVYNGRGTVLLLDSTVMSNTSITDGGGIYNYSQGTLVVVNSTVSGNSATRNGGGLVNGGLMQLYNATVTNNQADAAFNGSGTSGGIYSTGVFEFRNTILAANYDTRYDPLFKTWVPHTGDCYGTLTSYGYNLLQNYNTTNCTINGGGVMLVDPQLGPLQDNGGLTWTHVPLIGSPAINGGNPTGCLDNNNVTLTTDQRGYLRLGRCDVGAVENGSRLALPIMIR